MILKVPKTFLNNCNFKKQEFSPWNTDKSSTLKSNQNIKGRSTVARKKKTKVFSVGFLFLLNLPRDGSDDVFLPRAQIARAAHVGAKT